jgi:hypothetical protein
MRNDEHERAHQLIDRATIEGIEGAEREWLDHHLETCATCAALAGRTDTAIRGLRREPVELPVDLAARTQYRLSLRVRETPARRHAWALWLSFALSWILGIACAPLVWRGFTWAGQFAGISPLWLKLSFGLWWGLPAALAAGIWAIENRKIEER